MLRVVPSTMIWNGSPSAGEAGTEVNFFGKKVHPGGIILGNKLLPNELITMQPWIFNSENSYRQDILPSIFDDVFWYIIVPISVPCVACSLTILALKFKSVGASLKSVTLMVNVCVLNCPLSSSVTRTVTEWDVFVSKSNSEESATCI